jgi:flagellar motility protein MotE (MotC chaperone)
VVAGLVESLKGVTKVVEQMRKQRQHHEEVNARGVAKRGGRTSRIKPVASTIPTTGGASTSGGGAEGGGGEEGFGMENEILQAQLESSTQDSSQIEARMSEISNLLSLFTTNITEQNEQIEGLQDDAEDTKDNMEKGNEELMKAAQHMSAFRKFILAFLYSASFLLLFLDYMM